MNQDAQQALATLKDYIERTTHWQEGGATRHDALLAVKQIERLNATTSDATPEADPLQGAANWLKSAIEDLQVSDLAGRLSIGFNRASRLLAASPDSTAPHAQGGGQ